MVVEFMGPISSQGVGAGLWEVYGRGHIGYQQVSPDEAKEFFCPGHCAADPLNELQS